MREPRCLIGRDGVVLNRLEVVVIASRFLPSYLAKGWILVGFDPTDENELTQGFLATLRKLITRGRR